MRSLVTQPPVVGSSQPGNPDISYEALGYTSGTGVMTSVASGSPANTKGSYVTIGTTTNAWCEFELQIWYNNNAFFTMDLRIGGVVLLPDLWVGGGQWFGCNYRVPLRVPAGTLIEARCQATTATNPLNIGLVGTIAHTSLPPGFAAGERINPANGTNFPNATNIPFSSSGPTWTQLAATTPRAYGAVLAGASYNGTNPGTLQNIKPVIGVDPAAGGSYVEYGFWNTHAQNSSAGINWNNRLFEQDIPAGASVAGAVRANTPGTDNARFWMIGFYG